MMQAINWTPEHVAAFAPSVEASPMAPLVARGRVLNEWLLRQRRRGDRGALRAVKGAPLPLGNRLDIVGLVSDGARIESAPALEALRRFSLLHGINYITMMTRRDHVARACTRAGWRTTGVVMVGQVNHV